MMYEVKAEAVRENFMERPTHETHTFCIIADTKDDALEYVAGRLSNGGWHIKSLNVEKHYVFDIRGGEERIL